VIVRTLNDARQSPRHIVTKTWESTRLLLKNDGMGFSFHITTMYAGTETRMCYRNHLESVYCICGEGEIENLADGTRHPISAGTIYILDQHDEHIVRPRTDLTFACVFNPPLHGKEVHDASGAYPLEAEAVKG